KYVLVRSPYASLRVHRIDEGAPGVEEHPRANGDGAPIGPVDTRDVARRGDPDAVFAASRTDGFDVVGRDATVVERAANEVPDEACIVVVEIRVGVLEPAVAPAHVDDGLFALDRGAGQPARGPGEEVPDQPVKPRSEHELEETVAKPPGVHRIEPDLLNGRRVAPDQVIARQTELPYEPEFERLHVLDAAPGQVRRLLARERREVSLVDERDLRPSRRETRGRDGAVDTPAHDEHVEHGPAQAVDVGATQGRHCPRE